MIDEVMIAGALRKVITGLTKIEDKEEFVKEVYGALCRFKTNLYMEMSDDDQPQDPNELINICITGGGDLVNDCGVGALVRSNPTYIRIHGTRAIGTRDFTQGLDFLHQLDISDIFPASRFPNIEHVFFRKGKQGDRKTLNPFWDLDHHGCYLESSGMGEGRAVVTFILTGIRHPGAVRKKHRETADRHPGSEGKFMQPTEVQRHRQKLEDKENPHSLKSPSSTGHQAHMQFMPR